jgi:hypothetical protein
MATANALHLSHFIADVAHEEHKSSCQGLRSYNKYNNVLVVTKLAQPDTAAKDFSDAFWF